MRFADQSYNIRYQIDTENCELSPEIRATLENGRHALHAAVAKFPVSDLLVSVTYHPRSNNYRVKATLILTGETLVTGDTDEYAEPAFHHALGKLVRKVETYRDELEGTEERSKMAGGTRREVLPTREPELELLEQAVASGDYAAFRQALYAYEEPLTKRAGRWVERYPEVNALMDGQLSIADLVEEVYLNAFEHFDRAPRGQTLGHWLESLIDPSVRAIAEHPDQEAENIQFARSWREAAIERSRPRRSQGPA
jgi:ribosome-associated translation inhibitor RaiA